MNALKKSLFAAIVVSALAFTATGVQAKDCLPGCDCPAGPGASAIGGGGGAPGVPTEPNSMGRFGGILGAMEKHSDAVRVRDKSYSRQIIKQNDNALSMTCFDTSLMQSSKMGQIFSDVIPSNMPIANNTVFGTSTYPNANADSVLIKNISDTLSGPIQNHATNFPYSLSSLFGWANLGSLGSFVGGLTGPGGLITGITGAAGGLLGQAGSLSSQWSTLQGLINALSSYFPIAIPGFLGPLMAQLQTLLNMANGAMGGLTGAMSSFTGVMNGINISGGAMNPDDPCRALSKIWGGGGGMLPAGFKSIVGSGSEGNTPYASFRNFLNPGSLGLPASSDMFKELTNGNNSAIMSRASSLFSAGGLLNAPGGMGAPTPWKAPPPAQPLTATTADIINLMN